MNMSEINLNKDIRKEFNKVKQELSYISKYFINGLAKQANNDLKEVHEMIINDFYDSYDPSSYNRSYGLYNSLITNEIYESKDKNINATITIGSFGMQDYYSGDMNPDNIFDLMWNKGVRGLPKRGLNPLNHTYSFAGNTFYEGERWENPYWDPEEYNNIFLTQIKLGRYTSIKGTPHNVMKDITSNWSKAKGKDTCNRLLKEIKNKYS